MAVCTFFGHKDTPETIAPVLQTVLIDLIEHEHVTLFYIGNHGTFDLLVKNQLNQLKKRYPTIQTVIVLAYLPINQSSKKAENDLETIYPEGMEHVHPKYAIIKRNRWMLDQSDYVITYVAHSWGGAAQFASLAQKKGKVVINLSNQA